MLKEMKGDEVNLKLTAMYVSILKIKTNSRLGIKLLHHDQKILSNRY